MAEVAEKKELSRPLEAEYARLQRILQMIQLLQNQDGWDARRHAEACGVTQRTIYRDLKLLEGASIPFAYDPQTRSYRIRGDFYMRPLELSFDEALALVALGEHVAKDEQIPFTLAAARAVAKIKGELPDHVRRELAALDRHLSIRLSAAGPTDGVGDVYARMQQAMARRQCLRCRYESAKTGNPASFVFKPYKLHFDRRAWYAIGHHSGHDDVRCLKLSRFIEIQIMPERFEVPRSFSMEKYMGNAWRMIRGQNSYEVEVVFDAEFSENIADTHWHKTQKIEWQDDGSLRFRCTVDGLEEIQWWVLARGQHCRVIKPRELAQRVRDIAAATAAQYPKES